MKMKEPKTYHISIGGYGGEIVYGRLTKEQFEYWKEREDDFEEYVGYWGDRDENEEWSDVPEHARIEGEWYDNDDILHENGCSVADSWVQVESEDAGGNREEIFDGTGAEFAEKVGVRHIEDNDEELPVDAPYVYFGMSVEKGHFHTFSFESVVPPQWNLLRYDTATYPNGDTFFYNLYFVKEDGSVDENIRVEDYDGYGGTTGKAMYHELFENFSLDS